MVKTLDKVATLDQVNTIIASDINLQGDYDAATNTPDLDTSPSGISKGFHYVVSVAGTFFTAVLEVGDSIISKIDNPTVLTDWILVQVNLTAPSIKTLYESNADTNEYDDAEQTKLAGIEALADVTDAINVNTALDRFTVGSIIFSDGSILTEDNTKLFWDNANKRFGIGTIIPLDILHIVGAQEIDHTSTEADDHALDVECDAAGFGDVKAVDVDYITGAISAGEDEGIILVNIDESAAGGGEVFALEVLTTTEGTDTVVGLKTGVGVDPISQLSGSFGNPTLALNKAVDVLAAISSGGAGNITMFADNSDTVTIGLTASTFDEMEVIIGTPASGGGIAPTFEYSDGEGTFASFTPTDGTNGFKNTGVILWDASDLSGWVTSAGKFLIRITRNRTTVNTDPIVDIIQIVSSTIFSWDKSGNVKVNDLNVVGNITSGTWAADVITSAFLDADTAHLTTTQTFSGDKRFNGEVSIGGAAVAGKTLAITIPDNVLNEGIKILNTDGSIELINGTSAINSFLSLIRLNSGGANMPSMVIGSVPVADDTGTKPVLRLDARQADNTAIVTRPLVGISNNGSDVFLVAANGALTLGTITTGVWQGVSIANAFVAQLPALGSAPSPARQTAITNAELAGSIALSKLLTPPEANATADQTGAEIKTAYEAEANAYTDTKNTKLAGIETAADVTDLANVNAALATIVGTIATGVWQGTVVANAFLDADTAHLTTTQTFSGAKTFTLQTIHTAGADMTGDNVDNIQNLIHDLSTATTALDFANNELQEISIAANTTFTGTGYAIGKSKVVKITTDATLRTLTFPAGWVFVGTKPADQAASKTGILSLTSFTAIESGVIASYAVEA